MRLVLGGLAETAILLCSSTAAFAGSQSMVSGGGQTHDGAAFGFNTKDAETGDFNYVGNTDYAVTVNGVNIPAGSKFQSQCFEYMRVKGRVVVPRRAPPANRLAHVRRRITRAP